MKYFVMFVNWVLLRLYGVRTYEKDGDRTEQVRHCWFNSEGFWRFTKEQKARRSAGMRFWIVSQQRFSFHIQMVHRYGLGLTVNLESNNSDDDIVVNLDLFFVAIYVVIAFERPYRNPREEDKVYGISLGETGIFIYNGNDGSLWCREWQDVLGYPIVHLHGEPIHLGVGEVDIPAANGYPGGTFQIEVIATKHSITQKLLPWHRFYHRLEIKTVNEAPVVSGKGENAWDCEDDELTNINIYYKAASVISPMETTLATNFAGEKFVDHVDTMYNKR